MARKKQPKRENTPKMQGFIAGAGEIQAQDINDTLRQNYMPYAMSVIMSRAIPEIDGFKPSHRKLLYTMYKMNLLGSARTKSANIVGQTMKRTRMATVRFTTRWCVFPAATRRFCTRM